MVVVNKENCMQRMPVATIFLCILQVATLGNTSPVPHGIHSMKNEQQTDVFTGPLQRETPNLSVPVSGFVCIILLSVIQLKWINGVYILMPSLICTLS
jgi:hypothetical protein